MKFRGITKFDDSFLFKRMQENELQGISKTQMEIVIYAKTVKKKKLRICSLRYVGYVNKIKESSELDSNQRPKDINYAATVHRSTN